MWMPSFQPTSFPENSLISVMPECTYADGQDHLQKIHFDTAARELGQAWSTSLPQLCLNELMVTTTLTVLTDTREKYDGTRRSPWNEIECGDHYVRPMAAFLFFEIASGQTWSLSECGNPVIKLGFAPRINPSDFCGFFITGLAWGQFKQQGDAEMRTGTAQLCVHYGELRLSQLTLKSRATAAVVRMGGGTNETAGHDSRTGG
ncbi:hypothetical protein OS493_023219 [Desmophyllum pertusum]|uniref:Uncharacterized protein n=1 Tax=Desmophyllum pertusum TaxID=174260 RepID=A0A9W9YM67_9CNID|nr:hypothetical protein OS493_023219 [Desmophyllum pertusum]